MITQNRDLRTGISYWQNGPDPCVPTSRLAGDVETDVLVIGAGITGSVIAECLSGRHQVVVVDRRGLAKGSTLASTALVEYEIDTPLTHLSRSIGPEAAARAWRRSHGALNALADRTRALAIECGARRRDSLYLSGDLLDADAMRFEAEVRQAIGLENQLLSQAELRSRFGIVRDAGLLAFDDFEVDPRLMATGYLRIAVGRGAKVFAPVDVSGIESTETGVAVISDAGPVIRARHVVLATGYELPTFLASKAHAVISTYAIATRPQPENLWPERCLVWEASEPYLYMRATEDGAVICGGEDEEISDASARDALIDSKAETIARKLGALFPRLDATPVLAWAGAFGTTNTGLPLIGEIPDISRCWAALGFGGNGMTYSRIAAEIIAAAIDGAADPDADLYAFN
jgi:glycine/D-amino acid oxidase-like deaminating enzyme